MKYYYWEFIDKFLLLKISQNLITCKCICYGQCTSHTYTHTSFCIGGRIGIAYRRALEKGTCYRIAGFQFAWKKKFELIFSTPPHVSTKFDLYYRWEPELDPWSGFSHWEFDQKPELSFLCGNKFKALASHLNSFLKHHGASEAK